MPTRPPAKSPAKSRKPTAQSKPATPKPARPKPATPKSAQPKPATPRLPQPKPAQPERPGMLRVAAGAQALEAVGMCVATAYSAAATISGKSYQTASGIALTLIAFGTALALAAIAFGIAKARLWSRTPALLTQLFAVGAGIYLMDGHRPEWGIPTLILAAAGFTGLLAPDSFKALNRGRDE